MFVKKTTTCVCALAIAVLFHSAKAQEEGSKLERIAKDVEASTIEVVFVLDTTGSMSALIEGAKRKIWSIANEVATIKPTPTIRIGLVAYRDRGDAYVTQRLDLTDDLDLVFAKLQGFKAQGGGDSPESVNAALNEAVTKMAWTTKGKTLRVIFLVGDAPPHMDYQDDVKYVKSCETAARAGIVINAIQCGTLAATTPIWKDIATRAEGGYVAIAQTGAMTVLVTPMDKEIADLNRALGTTMLICGTPRQKFDVGEKQKRSEDADAETTASRLGYNFKFQRVVQGEGDLIDGLTKGTLKLEDMKDTDLPKEMQSMTLEERKTHVKKTSAERAGIQKNIQVLLTKRNTYLLAERKKTAGKPDAFDAQVLVLIKKQCAAKGIEIATK